MMLDACAIISLITDEPTKPFYADALAKAKLPFTSSLAAWEAVIVLSNPAKLNLPFKKTLAFLLDWLEIQKIGLQDINAPVQVLTFAVEVAEAQGIGKKALSNLDCFHFAYAKALGVGLLTLDQKLLDAGVGIKV